MSGNAYEWTSSQNEDERIYCGGGCGSYPEACEIDREHSSNYPKNEIFGFRLVRTITEENTDN